MSRSRPNTVTLALDERARIPFAMVGVLLLLTSVAIVGALSLRTAPETNVDVSVAMDQAFAGAQSEVRGGIQDASRAAATEPVTGLDDLADTPVGNAIEEVSANDEEVFRNYVKLRIYLQAKRNLAATSQRVGDVRTETTLGDVHYTKDSVKDAIDQMSLETGLESSSMEPGTLNVTIEDVTATAYHDGESVGSRTENMTVSVATTVFPLHQKVETYEQRLNSGSMGDPDSLRFQTAARLYPLAWAKAGYERVEGDNPTPVVVSDSTSVFNSVIENREVTVLANSGVFSVQHRTFGTKDPAYLESMAPAWSCMVSKTIKKVASQRSRANRLSGTVCSATGFLFSDQQLPIPNSISGLVSGVSESTRDQTYATRRDVTINITKFTYPAKQDVLDEPIDWTDPSNPLREDWEGDSHDDEQRPPNSDEIEAGEMPETVDRSGDLATKVIDEVYSAQASYSSSSSQQGSVPEASNPGSGRDWDKESDDVEWRDSDVEVTSFDKRFSESGTLPRDITYYDVTAEVNREARNVEEWDECTSRNESTGDCENWEDRRVTTDWNDIGYTLSFTIEGSRSSEVEVEARGVRNGVAEGGSPNPYSGTPENFDTMPEEAVRRTTTVDLSNGSELTATKVENAIDPDDVDSESDLEDEILASSHSEWSPAPEDREQLKEWLAEDIEQDLYPAVNDDFDPITMSMVETVTSDNPYQQFLTRIEQRKAGYIYDGGGAYDNVPALARAEARHLFFNETKQWIENINERRQQNKENANDNLQADTNIDEGLANAQQFVSDEGSITLPETTDPGTVDTQLMGNVDFRVKGAPSYLSMQPVMGNTEPAVRPAGEGPEDPENTIHAPFSSKVSGGPMPGLPLVPLPGYWVASVNGWDVEFQGEYARFSVTASTDDTSGSKSTTYVRQEQPVHVEINGVDRQVGKVPALNFSNNVPIVVAMPGATVMPKGTWGAGEREKTESGKHQLTECSATWKFVGPGYTPFKRTPQTDGTAAEVGQKFKCENQQHKAAGDSPAVTVLRNPSASGAIDAAEDIAEERFEEIAAGPTNVMDEDDDDEKDELEETGIRDSKLVVEFLDPGPAGAAILVQRQAPAEDDSMENETMLVDTGHYRTSNAIVEKLEERDVDEIDHLVITHNHSDHIGGLFLDEHSNHDEGILSLARGDELEIDEIYFNGVDAGTENQDNLRDALRGMAVDRQRLARDQGDRLDLGPGVEVDVLNPPSDNRDGNDDACDVNEEDCNSIVLRITKDGHSFLLTSDIRENTEADLAEEGLLGDEDVLQLAHHGGSDSNVDVLEKTDPDITVFTGGEKNIDAQTRRAYDPTYDTINRDVRFEVTDDGRLVGPDQPVTVWESDDD